MSDFGKKMTEIRKEKKISQAELAKMLQTSTSVIGRYERGVMTPSIEVAKKIADLLNTTVGYLLGETEQVNILKNSSMLDRLNDIDQFPIEDKNHIIYTLDALISSVKTREVYARK